MDFLIKIPKKNNNLAWRIIDSEAVVILLENISYKEERFHIFNETATRIWGLIDGKNSVQDIIKKIIDEYDIKNDECQSQVKRLISDMAIKKMITI